MSDRSYPVLIIVLASTIALAGLWDVYVIARYGLGSGLTVSWQLYSNARRWPVIAFAAGYGLRWALPSHAIYIITAFLAGHIFFAMKGSRRAISQQSGP